ncbi:calcium:proton antiporter [Brachybacterium muris]|uniref:calcium:proton antiporter n=1 Tax=Brachybacterium muris TaxID=219301 RepID=UPI00195BC9C9|nr:calcium:proton antiporter [Brachybacterium muris]MCT1996830.1 calcium:proton antiporter [Brachybacterium muris]MCT2297129.1 calcium:proton antiporter [Brachybacterium muris]
MRRVLTRAAAMRLIIGWAAVGALALAGPLLAPPVPGPLLIGALAVIIAVILLCAFGVVHEAEALAHRLGDPYGTLVLTLSIVTIEVVLIAAVMLGPGDHTTIARDSVMAVSMIILNLIAGVCLLVGGLRHGDLRANRTGALAYTTLLVVLSATAFALPAMIGADGAYTPAQAVPVIAMTLGLYGFFLWRQMGAQAADFQEVTGPAGEEAAHRAATVGSESESGTASESATASETDTVPDVDHSPSIREIIAEHRPEVLARTALLVATVLPIVLLSHDMATLLDDGLGRVGAPVALAGVLIAMIVFTPESITAVRAALGGEMQRVVNLCHGALVSTVGLTIPTVLVIGLLTEQHVVFAESPANLLLLGTTLALTAVTAASPRVTAMHGAAHLMLFALYALALFS